LNTSLIFFFLSLLTFSWIVFFVVVDGPFILKRGQCCPDVLKEKKKKDSTEARHSAVDNAPFQRFGLYQNGKQQKQLLSGATSKLPSIFLYPGVAKSDCVYGCGYCVTATTRPWIVYPTNALSTPTFMPVFIYLQRATAMGWSFSAAAAAGNGDEGHSKIFPFIKRKEKDAGA